MEICPVVSVLIHADGQTDERTDMTKLIVAFRNYINAPKTTRATQQLHLECSSEFLQNKQKPTTNYVCNEERVSSAIQVVTQKGFNVHH